MILSQKEHELIMKIIHEWSKLNKRITPREDALIIEAGTLSQKLTVIQEQHLI